MPAVDQVDEIEVLDGELVHVVAEPPQTASERLPALASQQAMQTAVAAATGFVAGAATVALLRRYGLSRLERVAEQPALAPPRTTGARTYVVHVRQLG